MPWLGALLFPAGAAVLLFACAQAGPGHTLSAALLLLALGLSDDLLAQPLGTCFLGMRQSAQGTAVLLMMHAVERAARLADRLLLLHAGRIVGTWMRAALAMLAAQGQDLLQVLTAAARDAEIAR